MLMAYHDEGSGDPVLLLHSGVADRRMWEAQAARLRTTRRVVRPDLRGFGDTPLPAERFGFTDDVLALLDHLGLDRVTAVGSSFGGLVALDLAARSPELVEALLLLCPAFPGLERTATATRFGAEEDALLEAGDVAGAVELNVRTWLGPDASEENRELVRTMQRHAFDVQIAAEAGDEAPENLPLDPDPGRVTARTLVVSGDRDMDHFQAIAKHLAATIPGARLVTLPWAQHLPGLERPGETTAIIEQFLDDSTRLGTDEFGPFVEGLDFPMFVVTTAHAGERAGCLVGFGSQVSIDPPRMLVCLSVKNRTYDLAKHAELLAVHVLDPGQRDLAELFGGVTGDDTDKFQRCSWRPGPSGVPLLDGCPRRLVGRVLRQVPFGDHVGFLVEPTGIAVAGTGTGLSFEQVQDLDPGHQA